MTDQELAKALERYPVGPPIVLYHVDVSGGYVEAAASGRPVELRPGEFWLTTNVEARKDFRGGRGLEGNIVAFQLDNRFVSLLQDLSLNQRDASAGEKAMRELFNAEIAIPRVNFEGGGKGVKLPQGDFNIAVRVTPEAREFNRLFQMSTKRMDRVRYDSTQPAGARLVPYGKSGALGALTPGTPGSGMANHEVTQTRMIGGIMMLGAIVSLLDNYAIESNSRKDLQEWEEYIRKRQTIDLENGFLVVLIIKNWQPRDAIYATKSYVGVEVFEAYNLQSAEVQAVRTILPGLPPPSETISYTYIKTWWQPLKPRVAITAAQQDEATYGKEQWYPRLHLVQHSLEAPPDFGEAFNTLQASSMYDIIRVLNALANPLYEQLKSNRRIIEGEINRIRFRIACAAVDDHRSSSSFGTSAFLNSWQNAQDLAALGSNFDRNCIKDWVASGTGAIQNDLQGRWDVSLSGKQYEYSFRLDGSVNWRDKANPGPIGGQGNWEVRPDGVRIQWPATGTVETFLLPLNVDQQKARCAMKTGTFDMSARKTNPNP